MLSCGFVREGAPADHVGRHCLVISQSHTRVLLFGAGCGLPNCVVCQSHAMARVFSREQEPVWDSATCTINSTRMLWRPKLDQGTVRMHILLSSATISCKNKSLRRSGIAVMVLRSLLPE